MFESRRIPDGAVRRFSGAKVDGTIPVRGALVGDVLIQASLDPAVSAIEYLATAKYGGYDVAVDGIVVSRDGRRLALDVVEARPLRSMDDDGLVLLALNDLGIEAVQVAAAEIRREPLYSNARIVWSYRGHRVPIGLRMRILQLLSEEGPLRLGDLLKAIRATQDPSPAILALACADVIELELATLRLGPETKVSTRRTTDGR